MTSIALTTPLVRSFFNQVYSGRTPSTSVTSAVREIYQAQLEQQLLHDAKVTSVITRLKGTSDVIEVVRTTDQSMTTTVVVTDQTALYPSPDLTASPTLSVIENLNLNFLVNSIYREQTIRQQREHVAEALRPSHPETDFHV